MVWAEDKAGKAAKMAKSFMVNFTYGIPVDMGSLY